MHACTLYTALKLCSLFCPKISTKCSLRTFIPPKSYRTIITLCSMEPKSETIRTEPKSSNCPSIDICTFNYLTYIYICRKKTHKHEHIHTHLCIYVYYKLPNNPVFVLYLPISYLLEKKLHRTYAFQFIWEKNTDDCFFFVSPRENNIA